MWFGCRECNLGPCRIEKQTLIDLIDEKGNLKENTYIPKHFCTLPRECISYFYKRLEAMAIETLTGRKNDWSVDYKYGSKNHISNRKAN